MERKSKNGGFRLKGHSLPGIKQFKSTKFSDGRAKSSTFQKTTDPTPSEKHDKPSHREIKDGKTIISSKTGKSRPRSFEVLQDDGTYKTVTNPSGSAEMTAKDLRNIESKYVTKEMDEISQKTAVNKEVAKINKKLAKKQKTKQTIKNIKKKVVNVVKDPLGIKLRQKKKRQKAIDELNKS
tara:strand:- start:78 stop:620 length:543 start_codon:yes stop_codon:yes gene_type:complete